MIGFWTLFFIFWTLSIQTRLLTRSQEFTYTLIIIGVSFSLDLTFCRDFGSWYPSSVCWGKVSIPLPNVRRRISWHRLNFNVNDCSEASSAGCADKTNYLFIMLSYVGPVLWYYSAPSSILKFICCVPFSCSVFDLFMY